MATNPSAGTPFLTTTEIVDEARKRLSDAAWDFICGGAETETTLLRNRYSLDAISFRPRVLRNVESSDPSAVAFGVKRRLPVLLAPLAGMTEFHEAGALPSAEIIPTNASHLPSRISARRMGFDASVCMTPELAWAAGFLVVLLGVALRSFQRRSL